MQAQGDRRERKKQAVRQALERAALELFDEHGFAHTTIDQIADRADVSRSTFFRYFGSKEAVLFSGYDENGELFAELILARPPGESPLVAFARAFIDLAQIQAETVNRQEAAQRRRILEREPTLQARSQDLTRGWTVRLAETLARRDGQDEPNREHLLAASVGMAVAERAADEYFDPTKRAEGEEIVRDLFALLKELVI